MASVISGVGPLGERNAFAKHILSKWVKSPSGIEGLAGNCIAGTEGENRHTLAGKAALQIARGEVEVMIHATPLGVHWRNRRIRSRMIMLQSGECRSTP